MGYKNGDWEFCHSSSKIHLDLRNMTGGRGILALDMTNWRVSDDTVMHLATAEGLVIAAGGPGGWSDFDQVLRCVASETKKCAQDFAARAPGKSEQQGLKLLEAGGANWHSKPFDRLSVGCGAAMRAMAVGLCFSALEDIVSHSVEVARISKTHPVGYLGAVVAALFTAFALEGRPVETWGRAFLEEGLPAVQAYVLAPGRRHQDENRRAFEEAAFEEKWRWYLNERKIADATPGAMPSFPREYDVPQRDAFYAEVARMEGVNPVGKNPGSKGYDAVLIAYDAILWVECSGDSPREASARWGELCMRAALHRGDNDSTGSIAASWYGALRGFAGVPHKHYRGLEYRVRCESAGRALYRLRSSTH